jgi:nucleolar protein 14
MLSHRQDTEDLPFTFPCPDSHDHWLEIIEDVPENQLDVVIQRIMTLYHPSLAVDNKIRLQASVFTSFSTTALTVK